jgi:O-acetyl-ADP-ribose deacetylase (regulator of RNase III)
MITLTKGNLIEADAEALVNSVNCEGYMGKGIALQFKKAFPENFKSYQRACRAGEIQPGRMFVYATGAMMNPRYIINFPTKRKWRSKSKLEDIRAGLRALVEEVRERGIGSIAVPPLGCGLGGLKWEAVKPIIEYAFAELPQVRVLLFEPAGAPAAKAMPVRTRRPKMTLARALLIRLMRQYTELAHRLTLLEVQKLAYILQESGEPLRLKYVKHFYGPYAHNLNKVLEALDGHFIRGYGDSQAPDAEIELVPTAIEEADQFLAGSLESRARLRRVAEVIDSFETPYGMELIASVHWIAHHETPRVTEVDEAVRALHGWSDRKRAMFKPVHIRVAWERLRQLGWLPSLGAVNS